MISVSPDALRAESRIPLLACLAIAFVVTCLPRSASAVIPNVPICTATNRQEYPAIDSDGAGGAIVAWLDSRTGSAAIRVQRMDSAGLPRWTPDGVALCPGASANNVQVVADGGGGGFVAWQDARSGDSRTYVQRVSAAGTPSWIGDGVSVCGAASSQVNPTIVSDGTGGAIVAWRDDRTDFDIYAQHLSASGALLWAVNGLAVCLAVNDQQAPRIVSDGAGGAIVTWRDIRSDAGNIYTQRVSAAGIPQWTTDGVALCLAADEQSLPTIVSDGAGGAIVTWRDNRVPGFDIYAQRVSAGGVAQWTAGGVALCTSANDQTNPTIVSDDVGGAIVTWYDRRGGTDDDIYAQRVSAAGATPWTANGVALCTAAGYQQFPTIVSDGAEGAIVTWYDDRSGPFHVYSQRVDAAGTPQWTADGVILSDAAGGQVHQTTVSDGTGGAIATWFDSRNGNFDIYAQRVQSDGALPVSGPLGWMTNGSGVATAPGVQQRPCLVSDQQGGAIFGWEDHGAAIVASGSDRAGGLSGGGAIASPQGPGGAKIRMVRLDPAGGAVPSWPPSGLPVSSEPSSQVEPATVEDAAGGAIVVWKDDRNTNFDLFAQRVTAAGAIVGGWPAIGAVVCTATGDQQHPSVVPDGAGGAFVFWEDTRNGGFDLYAQRITSAGTAAAGWPANGIAVCVAIGDQLEPAAVADGVGGAIVSWKDHRGASWDIYALRVTPAGATVAGWTANGTLLAGPAGDQVDPVITSDGQDGALVAWGDARTDASDVYAQHVTGSGAIAAGWLTNGNALCTSSSLQQRPSMVSDGVGGTIVGWEDARSGGTGFDLYAQRIGGGGLVAAGWTIDGMPLCVTTADQQAVELTGDGRGGAIASWQDGRSGSVDVYANQITAAGTIDSRWPANGLLLSNATGNQLGPAIVADGAGGAVVCWTDERVAASDVYALRIFGVGLVPLSAVEEGVRAAGLRLSAPRPNPARAAITLAFELSSGGRVRVDILDVAGRRVRTLVDRASFSAGSRSVVWDAMDDAGHRAHAGIYFVRIEAGDRRATERFALVE